MIAEKDDGFSLLEVMVASLLLAIAVIGTGHLFVAGEVSVAEKGFDRAALNATRSKLQELQRLPGDHADLSAGVHQDPGNPIVLDDRNTSDPGDDLRAYRRWTVVDVDDPADGTGEAEPDYREVHVEVAGDSGFNDIWGELRTLTGG